MNKMKNIIRNTTAAIFFSAAPILTFAQQGASVWVTIEDVNTLPYKDPTGKLLSMDAEFNTLITELNITHVEKAIPSSRKASLLKVYEVSCDCEAVDLYSALIHNVNAVSKVEYAPVYETLDLPNDYTLEVSNPYALNLIDAEGAWEITTGDSNVVIAISDQNYYVNHEDLLGKVTYYDNTNTSSQGHGTAVATLAAGSTNNGVGKSAVGYNSSLALYRMNYNEVLNASYNGARVVNLSWTSGCSYNQYLQDVMTEVYENGTFIVASAGNGSTCGGAENLVYPSAYDHVFSVTSIGENDNHERNMGDPNSTHQHNASVDLSAPGYYVPITAAPGWYYTGSGTSYASPIVSGTVGLMVAVNPCISNSDIESILKSSSSFIDDINPLYSGLIGSGRLNAAAAVKMAKELSGISLTANSYTSCTENSGEIHVEITGGNSPYTVEWSNGATATSLSGLSGGSYTISVSDALGCSIDSTFVVNVVTPTVFEGSVGHVVCNGESNGSIDLTILDGSPGYIFEWDNGMSSEDLYGLSPGTYRVKITDGNGCSVYASYDVLEPEELSATILVEQPSNIENGNIDLSVEGGTLPYTYTWNTGDLSEDLYNISAGYYGATVIDDNGCVLFIDETVQNINTASINDTESFSITVFPNPTKDLATITWESIDVSHIVVINTSGQLVQSSNSFAQKSFKTNALTQGVYFINITDNNNNKTTHKHIVK
jgi:hypothetical protein